jgi:hypothetical protein
VLQGSAAELNANPAARTAYLGLYAEDIALRSAIE